MSQVKTLDEVNAEGAQDVEGRRILDVFGDRKLLEVVRDLDHRVDKKSIGLFAGQVTNEESIELEGIDVHQF